MPRTTRGVVAALAYHEALEALWAFGGSRALGGLGLVELRVGPSSSRARAFP